MLIVHYYMRIFLFGSSGMLGNTIFKHFKNKYDIIDINRQIYDIEKNTFNELKHILNSYQISNEDIIINCIGLLPHRFNSDSLKEQKFCGEILKKFILINSIFPHNLEKIHLLYKCNVIHITSDCVYSGNKGKYNEKDIFDLFNIYAITKTSGEPELTCNIRTSIIGHQIQNIKYKKSLLDWVLSEKNNSIKGYSNYLWNGITCLQLSKIIDEIITKKKFWKGTRHIFSPDIVSKCQLCQYINEIYNLNINIESFNLPKKVDRTLSSIYENNFKIQNIKTQIHNMKDFHSLIN